MPLSPPVTMTTSCLPISTMASALSTAECTTSKLPAASPSRWLREFSVRWSIILRPRRSKIPLAMPACSGRDLACGKALTRSSVGSSAPAAVATPSASMPNATKTSAKRPMNPSLRGSAAARTAIIAAPPAPRPRPMESNDVDVDRRGGSAILPQARNPGETCMRAISLAEANRIIEGTFASAKKRKAYALAAIVLDAGGRVKAFQKQDGASLMRFEIAYGKAFGALALNRSSRQVLQKAKEKPAFMQSLAELADGPLFLEAGGQLIRDAAGEIVGALGVTGDVNEVDDLCAIDGIHAGGLRADADFDAEAARRLNIKVDPPLRDPRKKASRSR